MKFPAFVLALCLACPVWSQSLDQKVTFSTPATTTKAVLAALAKQTGVDLVVAGPAAEEIVAVHVKDAVLNDVLKRIAEVSTCEWKEEGKAYRLITSNGVRQMEARRERDAKVAELKKELATRVKSLQPGKAAEATPPVMGMFGGGGADAKAITRLLAELDISPLADLRSGQRIVFSSQPNRMQRPLGRNAATILGQYVAENNDEARLFGATRDSAAMSDEQRQAVAMSQQLMGRRNAMVTGTPYKALVIASRQELLGILSVEIRVYDREGKVILSGSDALSSSGSLFGDIMEAAIPAKPGAATPTDPDPTPIKFSKVAQEYSAFFGGLTMGGQGMNRLINPELRKRLLHPDEYDPLALVPSETLIAIADAKGVQLVANLPEGMSSPFQAIGAQTTLTIGRAMAMLLDGKVTKGEIKDGWFTLRPAAPDNNRRIRAPRGALAKLLQAGDSKGVPSLDDIAAYAGVAPPPMETPAAMASLMLFAPNAMQNGMQGPLDWTMLRFYSSLNPSQRASLASGAPIPLPNLSIGQRDLVTAMAFGSSARLRVGPPKQGDGGFMDMMQMFMPAATNDYREEPTELMPNGLPSAGNLRMNVTLDPIAVLAQAPEGAGGIEESSVLRGALGVDELAMFAYFKQDPNFAAVANMMPQLGPVRLGERKKLNFVFTLGPGVFMDRSLNDDAFDAQSKPVSLENLPQAFRDRINQRMVDFKKSFLPLLGGMGSGPPPPPPL